MPTRKVRIYGRTTVESGNNTSDELHRLRTRLSNVETLPFLAGGPPGPIPLVPLTTRGDLLTRNAASNVRLGIGAANSVLRSNGSDPAWSSLAGAGIVSGTGTEDTLPVWSTGGNALADSRIRQDNNDMFIMDGGGVNEARLDLSNLTTDRAFTFPDVDDFLVAGSGNDQAYALWQPDGTIATGHLIEAATGGFDVLLDRSALTADRVFAFPNTAGTFVLGTGTTGKHARWTSASSLGNGLDSDDGQTWVAEGAANANREGGYLWAFGAADGSASNPGGVYLQGGNSLNAAFNGGSIIGYAGEAFDASGTGGSVYLVGGRGPTGLGAGLIQIFGHSPGFGGNLTIAAGDGEPNTAGGNATITAGNGQDGPGGAFVMQAGGAVSGDFDGGGFTMFSGEASGGNGAGGVFNMFAGDGGGTSGNGGGFTMQSGGAQTGTGGALSMSSGDVGAVGNGGPFVMTAGAGGATSGDGGSFTAAGGPATTIGDGGAFTLSSGAGGNTSGDGGTFTLSAGVATSAGTGGSFNCTAGDSMGAGDGGTVSITAGNGGAASGVGGEVTIKGGSAIAGNNNGGNLTLWPGKKFGSGTDGLVRITDPTSLFVGALNFASLAADRTYTFPNASGTIALTSDLSAYQPIDTDLTEIAAVANVRGDLLLTDNGPAWRRLAVGTANTVLFSDGTDAAWGVGFTPTMTGVWTFSAQDIHNAGVSLGTSGVLTRAALSATAGTPNLTFTASWSGTANTTGDIAYLFKPDQAMGSNASILQVQNSAARQLFDMRSIGPAGASNSQFRFGFDSTHYLEIIVTSAGAVTAQTVAGGAMNYSSGSSIAFNAAANNNISFQHGSGTGVTQFGTGSAQSIVMFDGTVISNSANTTGLTFGASASDIFNKYGFRLKAGASTGFIGRDIAAIKQDTTQTGNTAITETDLFSYSVLAATLNTNGESVSFEYAGTFANSVNTKQIKVKFGATTIFDSGALAITGAGNWTIEGRVIRTGAATQKCYVRMTTTGATLGAYNSYATAAETLSGAVTLKITGTAVGASDIVGEANTVDWREAA